MSQISNNFNYLKSKCKSREGLNSETNNVNRKYGDGEFNNIFIIDIMD